MSRSESAHRILIQRAAESYRNVDRFAWHFARGKLAADPVFPLLLSSGLIPSHGRILDLGCGQGLLAAWLIDARRGFERGNWPVDWPPPPEVGEYRGIELAAEDVERARAALGAIAHFEQGDIRDADFGYADLVVILDVLHYLPPPDQEAVLQRVRDALPVGGLFLTRVGDASAGLPFLFSKWVDYVVAFLRWGRMAPLHCRSLDDWCALLRRCGFLVEVLPMRGAHAFANALLVARRAV